MFSTIEAQLPQQPLQQTQPIVGGADYPHQTVGYQYPQGYQPISQSFVYNPTTVPNNCNEFASPPPYDGLQYNANNDYSQPKPESKSDVTPVN